ncbi:MAG: hypothetical protein LBC46_03900 [Treponema sp.]|nr:hypothetical protein [Treponema sp.]
MKKVVLLVAICIALTSVPVFAQEEETENSSGSDYYYVNAPIQKVYPYRKGYVVTYRKGAIGSATTYLPLEWFDEEVGGIPKGEVILLGPGARWPYLAVYYKDGEFSHVRLYVRKERSHETWGHVPAGVDINDKFENVETIKLEF